MQQFETGAIMPEESKKIVETLAELWSDKNAETIKKRRKENYIKSIEDFYKTNVEISKRKSNDYASDTDPFSNFRKVENMGLTVAQGILVRMGDKMSRLEELLGKGKEGEVEDEKITDTLADLANYSAILAVYLKHERG